MEIRPLTLIFLDYLNDKLGISRASQCFFLKEPINIPLFTSPLDLENKMVTQDGFLQRQLDFSPVLS